MSYRLFGAETSAYSTKMRSYLSYKAFAFDWVPRTQESEDELQRVSRFATLPVLVAPSGFAVHDTTPLIEALEADSPEPSATPSDPALAFLASVLEEYADVWLAKAVFHYRWGRRRDQKIAAQRAVEEYYTLSPPEDRKASEERAIETMTSQLRLMQVDGELGEVVEKSFKKFVKLLDDHLRRHLFIFGERPSVADFAIAGQLIQMLKDPTPAKIIEKDGQFLIRWCDFMSAPTASGPFASLGDLRETLGPLFCDDLAVFFLPWAAENLESSLAGAETFTVTLGREALTLAPLRSAARSFRELRRKFVGGQLVDDLKRFTDEAGATAYLLRPQRQVPAPAPAPSEGAGEVVSEAAETSDETTAAGSEDGRPRRRRRRRSGRRPETISGPADDAGAPSEAAGDEDGPGAAEGAEPDDAQGGTGEAGGILSAPVADVPTVVDQHAPEPSAGSSVVSPDIERT